MHSLPAPVVSGVLDALRDAVVVTDRQGDIIYVNDAFTRLTGYRHDEVIGKNPRILRSGQQPHRLYAELWSTVLAGKTWHGEVVNRRKDGSLYADDMTIMPIMENGIVTHMVATKRDVDRTLGAMARSSPVGIAHLALDGRLLYANPRLGEMLGRSTGGLIGHGWVGPLHVQDRAAILELVRAQGTSAQSIQVRLPRGRFGTARVAHLEDTAPQALGVVLTIVDSTDEVRAHKRALEREQFAHAIIDGLTDPTVVLDRARNVVQDNTAWQALVGEIGGKRGASSLTELWPEGMEGASEVVALLNEAATSGELRVRELRTVDESGARWWLARAIPMQTASDVIVTLTDITIRKREELQLAERADHDPLTGLANRQAALAWLARAVSRGPVAVLFIDLDGFKQINDQFGHRAGDETLLTVTRRLLAVSRATDLVARLGGDEFLMLSPGVKSDDGAESVVARVREVVEQQIRLTDGVATVGVSVGFAVAQPGASLDDVIALADRRMYADKKRRSGAAEPT